MRTLLPLLLAALVAGACSPGGRAPEASPSPGIAAIPAVHSLGGSVTPERFPDEVWQALHRTPPDRLGRDLLWESHGPPPESEALLAAPAGWHIYDVLSMDPARAPSFASGQAVVGALLAASSLGVHLVAGRERGSQHLLVRIASGVPDGFQIPLPPLPASFRLLVGFTIDSSVWEAGPVFYLSPGIQPAHTWRDWPLVPGFACGFYCSGGGNREFDAFSHGITVQDWGSSLASPRLQTSFFSRGWLPGRGLDVFLDLDRPSGGARVKVLDHLTRAPLLDSGSYQIAARDFPPPQASWAFGMFKRPEPQRSMTLTVNQLLIAVPTALAPAGRPTRIPKEWDICGCMAAGLASSSEILAFAGRHAKDPLRQAEAICALLRLPAPTARAEAFPLLISLCRLLSRTLQNPPARKTPWNRIRTICCVIHETLEACLDPPPPLALRRDLAEALLTCERRLLAVLHVSASIRAPADWKARIEPLFSVMPDRLPSPQSQAAASALHLSAMRALMNLPGGH